jgi:hypothetical protein
LAIVIAGDEQAGDGERERLSELLKRCRARIAPQRASLGSHLRSPGREPAVRTGANTRVDGEHAMLKAECDRGHVASPIRAEHDDISHSISRGRKSLQTWTLLAAYAISLVAGFGTLILLRKEHEMFRTGMACAALVFTAGIIALLQHNLIGAGLILAPPFIMGVVT